MAVLNWNSCSISSVTFLMVLCVSLLRATVTLLGGACGFRSCELSGEQRSDSSCTSLHTRPRKRYAPSTPSSFHSRSFSGGAAKRENRRAVSAPYFAIKCSGSTMFFFDLDIFSTRPRSTGFPHWLHRHPSLLTSAGNSHPCSSQR